MLYFARWCNGSTKDSGSFCRGSNPCRAARGAAEERSDKSSPHGVVDCSHGVIDCSHGVIDRSLPSMILVGFAGAVRYFACGVTAVQERFRCFFRW